MRFSQKSPSCRSLLELSESSLNFVFLFSSSYSYYIEVSIDQKDWTRVVDHTQYYCRSWQYLYFEPRVVKFVRIVGTNNTVNKVFHIVSFEIMFTNKSFCMENGLVGEFFRKIFKRTLKTNLQKKNSHCIARFSSFFRVG